MAPFPFFFFKLQLRGKKLFSIGEDPETSDLHLDYVPGIKHNFFSFKSVLLLVEVRFLEEGLRCGQSVWHME